ncbi:hypothetical protein JZ751_008687 [Albula glossodonta]|uniref:Uncharacterized protein n=1 Tax=Albula glossodonta TaxID=121402 RepID=A0A8T2NX02_9TELE|nr:hypothetical protein JZ751_008687 [Albula glossodonta]
MAISSPLCVGKNAHALTPKRAATHHASRTQEGGLFQVRGHDYDTLSRAEGTLANDLLDGAMSQAGCIGLYAAPASTAALRPLQRHHDVAQLRCTE